MMSPIVRPGRLPATFAAVAVFAVAAAAQADAPSKASRATPIKLEDASGSASISGALEDGAPVALDWAAKSSMACFPATQNEHFDGNHVFFETSMPPKSEMTIRLVPSDQSSDLSLYAYQVSATAKEVPLPPSVHTATSCEASYGTKNRSQPFNPGAPESVKLTATTNGYRVVIGVAGAKKLGKAKFSLEVNLKTSAASPTTKVAEATKLETPDGTPSKVEGSIDSGTPIALEWAAKSSVACFPATKNEHFSGNHVVYEASIPAYSEMKIRLVPKDPTLDLSLYALEVGTTNKDLPPDVGQAVSCEASYGTKKLSEPYNPGQPESVKLTALKNPYRVLIGVAGAQKVQKGAFSLEVELVKRK